MTRLEILDLCCKAHTITAVRTAQEARSRWLADHPDDAAVRDMGEMLAMLEEGFAIECREQKASPLLKSGSFAAKSS